jgi:large subunit ribosomal protein L24
MHVKKGDNVIVTTGKDKGKSGAVVKVLHAENRVVVEGVNMAKKSTRPKKAGEKGGIVSIALSIHASNVKLADGKKKTEKKPVAKKAAKKTVKKESAE